MSVQNHCHPHGTLPSQPSGEQTYTPAPVRIPHACPVCVGRGFVDAGFYSSTGQTWGATGTTPETCWTCGGTGIVWDERPASPLAGVPRYSGFSLTIKPGDYQTYQKADSVEVAAAPRVDVYRLGVTTGTPAAPDGAVP